MKTLHVLGMLGGVSGMLVGLAGCATGPVMGEAVMEMVQAQTDTSVPADDVGGAMAGIGDKVGEAYRGHIDKPDDVKTSMGADFFEN